MMKPTIALVLLALSEFLIELELPGLVTVQSQAINPLKVTEMNNAKRNKVESKGETLYLECKQKGKTMECKPTTNQEKSKKNERTRMRKTSRHRNLNERHAKKKTDEHVSNLEAKLQKHDRKIAERLHKAIHEAHEQVPSFSHMLQLVNEIIDEEYQKHSKLVIKEETQKKKKKPSRRKTKERQKPKHSNLRKGFEDKGVLKNDTNDNAKRAKVNPSLRHTQSIKNTDKKNVHGHKKKQPLKDVKNGLEKKKESHKHKHIHKNKIAPSQDVQKVKASVRKLMEKGNVSKAITTAESNKVDINYILNRLASKRKEFLNKVICSANKDKMKTFDEVVDVPWIGFPGEANQQIYKKPLSKLKIPHVMNLKTPSLKLIPTKMNNYLEDEDSSDSSGEFDEETEAADTESKERKKILLQNILRSVKSKSMPIMYSTSVLALQSTEKLNVNNNFPIEEKKPTSSILPNVFIESDMDVSETSLTSLTLYPTPAFNFMQDNIHLGLMTITSDPNEFAGFSTSDEIYPDREEMKRQHQKSSSDSSVAIPMTSRIALNLIQETTQNDKLLLSVSATVDMATAFSSNDGGNRYIMDEILAETFDRNMKAQTSLSRDAQEKSLITPSSSKADMIFYNMIQATVYVPTNGNKINDSKLITGKNFLVRLNMLSVFNGTLADQRSDEYKKLKKLIEQSIGKLYKDDDTFHSSKIVSFSRLPRDNTTIVDMEIYFKMRAYNHLTRLEDLLKTSHDLGNHRFDENLFETSLLNDRITDIRWCLPPCYSPYHCFPICDDTCCQTPPNAFDTSHQRSPTNQISTQPAVAGNTVPFIVYNYILTTPEELTKHARDVFGSKPYEINAFTSQVDSETGNILCGPYCSPYYCLSSCFRKCCYQK